MKFSNGVHINNYDIYLFEEPMGTVKEGRWRGTKDQYVTLNNFEVITFLVHNEEDNVVEGRLNFPYFGIENMNPEVKAFCLEFPAHAHNLYGKELKELNAKIFSNAVHNKFIAERLKDKDFNPEEAVQIVRNLIKLILAGGEYSLREILDVQS